MELLSAKHKTSDLKLKKMNDIIDFLGSNIEMIYILVLSIFVGVEVIGHVPSVLHTPLMSGANAIHGVVIVGSIIVMLNAEPNNVLLLMLGFIAVILGTLNVVGGFVVTDRMLELFKKKKYLDIARYNAGDLFSTSELYKKWEDYLRF